MSRALWIEEFAERLAGTPDRCGEWRRGRERVAEGGSTTASKQADGVKALGRLAIGSCTRERTADPDEAEEIIAKHYLPNRLFLPGGCTSVQMDFSGLQMGVITAGKLSYGHRVRLLTGEAQNFHLNMPIRGRALSRCGQSESVDTAARQGLVFSPEAPAEITWSADCIQLCLMIPRAGLEAELERLLGRSVPSGLRFDFGVAAGHVSERLQAVLNLVAQELDHPSGLATSQVAGRHLEGLLLDGLLLWQPHNYSEPAIGFSGKAPGGVIKRAVDLLEERPTEPWTTVKLATELHLSARALQAGFKREVGMAPMAYLRMARVRRAHAALRQANAAETTVQAVALSLGLLHQGRFAASYRALFGETPSETLRR